MDYNAHHNEFGRCPAKGRKKPIIGKTYSIAKFKYNGDTSNSGTSFSVVDVQSIVYQVPFYSEEELLRMNNLYRAKGYYGKREFYKPEEADMLLPMPDARNVLMWKPDVITDENGCAEVEFFCSDINTNFIGIIEGTDGTGNIGTSMCEFNVWNSK